MDPYEELVIYAEKIGLEVKEKYFRSSAKGLCKGNKIGISKSITTMTEKRCVLAEEMAHSLYTVGNILDINNDLNYKQELFARRKAFEMLIPLNSIIDSFRFGNVSCYEIANDLDVTEEFLISAIMYYRNKYGDMLHYDACRVKYFPLKITNKEEI